MCYAIGTPNIPASKLRCDSSKGERRRASDAHAYAAKKQTATYESTRGRVIRPVKKQGDGVGTPYPVSSPRVVENEPTSFSGWSGMSPGQLIGGKKSKKPEPEPEPVDGVKPEPVDGVKPELVPEPEPEPEPKSEPEPEPKPEPETDRSEASVPEPKRCPATPKEPEPQPTTQSRDETEPQPTAEPQPTPEHKTYTGSIPMSLSASDLQAYRLTSTFEEFNGYITARTSNPDDSLYIPDDDQPESRELAVQSISHILYDTSPTQRFMYDEELAKQAKTPIYFLAETLSPTQREAVARAARFRGQQCALASRANWDSENGESVVNAATEVGTCITLAADLRFANAIENGEAENAVEQFSAVEHRMRYEVDTYNGIRDLTDSPSVNALIDLAESSHVPGKLTSSQNDAVLAYLAENYDTFDSAGLRETFKKSGITYKTLKRQSGYNDRIYDYYKYPLDAQIKKWELNKEQAAELEENYTMIMSIIEQQRGAESFNLTTPDKRRGDETYNITVSIHNNMDAQMELSRTHAEMVKDELAAIAPRATEYASKVTMKTTMRKKDRKELDGVAGFLNAKDMERTLERANELDLTVSRVNQKAMLRPRTLFGNLVSVELRVTEEPYVMLHETMHLMETCQPKSYGVASLSFLSKRTAGLEPHNTLTAKNVIADDFSDPYIGCIYPGSSVNSTASGLYPETRGVRGTEVLSVGAEQLLSRVWDTKMLSMRIRENLSGGGGHGVPATALYSDPEHVAYTYGALAGQGDVDLIEQAKL